MFTKARTIHKVAMEAGPVLVQELLAARGLRIADVAWMIPHQTSVRAIRSGEKAIAAATGERPGHTVVTVDELGNTASTTLFVALHRGLGDHWFKTGERVMLLSVASGLEIGALVFVMDELQETHERTH
jgi:3-oxoacyl-[acyl-carrier-protein] synthase-3